MGLPLERTAWTTEAFLAWENAQVDKHEFVGGEVFAMVGGRRVHGTVLLNLSSALRVALRGSRCRAFADSMKVQVEGDVFYPDVFVTCDPRDLRTEQVFRAPTVIVEVLSPSTQGYDRGPKFTRYRTLASLREYVLVDPELKTIEVFRRDDLGWRLHDVPAGDDATLDLASLGVSIAALDIFEGIDPLPADDDDDNDDDREGDSSDDSGARAAGPSTDA